MDEARSLQYSINVKADIAKAEEDIRNFVGSLGKLQSEAAGGIDICVGADTIQAEESVHKLTEDIGSINADDVSIGIDTTQAESDLQNLAEDIGNLGESVEDIDIDADTSEARQNIKGLTDDIGGLKTNAGSIGSAFRKSFLAGVDSGTSFSTSLRSGIGSALTYAGDKVTEFKDNVVTRMKGAADNVASSAKSIGHGFAHPIETIKTGLGGAIDSAKNKFVSFVRGADDAADAADDVGGASAGARPDVEGLGEAAEKSGSKFEKLGGVMKGIGKAAAVGLTAATVAVGGFAAASVNTGMTFGSSMSQVAATMGYSVEELNTAGSEANQTFTELRGFAMEMGANTAFSASQAADALNYMALAGYDAETSMTMLPNVLNLAAAGGIELASASDMVTDAQSALGLSLEETSELVDMMARTSSKSNTSVAQLGEAILTVGGTAKTLSGGTTELNMALGVLADNGIKGAEGGTALRNMILSLSAPTDKAAAQLKAMGIEAFDAEGNLRPLNETFGDLNSALSTMTQEEQTQALNEIFNKVDLKSVNAMLGTSAERFDELSNSIADSQGAAQAMADTQLDNLAGDITLFKSALEGAQIVISDQLTPNLREFVQFGSSAISTLSTAFQEGGLNGAMGALGTILSDGIGMVIEMLPALIEAGMQLIGALGQGLLSNIPVLIGAASQIVITLASGIGSALPELVPSVVETLLVVVSTIIENLPLILDAGMQVLGGLAQGIMDAIPLLIGQMPELILQIVGFLSENLPAILEQGSQMVLALGTGVFDALPQFLAQLPAIITGIVGFFTENLPLIIETGVNLVVQLGVGLIQGIPSLVAQLPQIVAAIIGGFAEAPGMMLDVGGNIIKGVWEGITGMGSWIKEKVSGFFGGIVNDVKGLLGIHSPSTVFAGIGNNMAQGVGKGFGESMAAVAKDIEGAIPTDVKVPAPEVDIPVIPEPDIPTLSNMTYGISPVVEDANIPSVKNATYEVEPVVKDFSQPVTADIAYNVMPVVTGADVPAVPDITYGVKPDTELADTPEVLDSLCHVNPVVDSLSNDAEDILYHVSPIVDDVKTPTVSDITYGVNPVVGGFNPPNADIEGPVSTSANNSREPADSTPRDLEAPPSSVPDRSSENNEAVPAFAPVINIYVQGNTDETVTEDLRTKLYNTVKELFEEFRNEEMEHMALKEQYAF